MDIFNAYRKKVISALNVFGSQDKVKSLSEIRNKVRELANQCVNIDKLNDSDGDIEKGYEPYLINGGRGFLLIPGQYTHDGTPVYEYKTVDDYKAYRKYYISGNIPELIEQWQDVANAINHLTKVHIISGMSVTTDNGKSISAVGQTETKTDYSDSEKYYSYSDSAIGYSAQTEDLILDSTYSDPVMRSKCQCLCFCTETENTCYDYIEETTQNTHWEVFSFPHTFHGGTLPAKQTSWQQGSGIGSSKSVKKYILVSAVKISLNNINNDHEEDGLVDCGCTRENFASMQSLGNGEVRYDLGTGISYNGVTKHRYITQFHYGLPSEPKNSYTSRSDDNLTATAFGHVTDNDNKVLATFSSIQRPNGVQVPIYWKMSGTTPLFGLPVTGMGYRVYFEDSEFKVRFSNGVVHCYGGENICLADVYKEENGERVIATFNGSTAGVRGSDGKEYVNAPQGIATIEYQFDKTSVEVKITYYDHDGSAKRVAQSSNETAPLTIGTSVLDAKKHFSLKTLSPETVINNFTLAGAPVGSIETETEDIQTAAYNHSGDGAVYLGDSIRSTWLNDENRTLRVTTKYNENGSPVDEHTTRQTMAYSAGTVRIASESAGSGTTARTTRYGYWDDVDSANVVCNGYGKLKYQINPDRSWQYLCYDENNRVSSEFKPFGNVALEFDAAGKVIAPAASACRVTEYDYTPQAASDTALPGDNRPRRIIERIRGLETARRYHVYAPGEYREELCVASGAQVGDANNLVTAKFSYQGSGNDSGMLKKIVNPDNTVEAYSYTFSGTGIALQRQTTTVDSGGIVFDPAGNVDTAGSYGTRTITTYDSHGHAVKREIMILPFTGSGTVVERYEYEYSLGKQSKVIYQDGTTEETVYACCGPLTVKHRDGSVKSYAYTPDKRVAAETYNGVVTAYTYDAAGNTTSVHTYSADDDSSGDKWTLHEYYDNGELKATKVGLELSENAPVDSDCAITNYSAGLSGDMWCRTTTLPDGGTVIEKYNADGEMAERSGTAVQSALYLTDMVDNTVRKREITVYGSSSATVYQRYDFAGRPTITYYPDGTTLQRNYDVRGRVWREINRNGVATLYFYAVQGFVEKTVLAVTNGINATAADPATEYLYGGLNDGVHQYRNYRERVFTTAGNNDDRVVTVQELECAAENLEKKIEFGRTTVTQKNYSGSGIMVETVTNPDGSSEEKTYNNGLLTSISATLHGSTTFTYDALNRVDSVTRYDGGVCVVTEYAYDGRDNVTCETVTFNGADARTTVRTYDNMNRVLTETLPGGRLTTYTYTPRGEIASVEGYGTYKQAYTYERGQIKTLTTYQDAATAAVTAWDYNAAGQLTRKTYADGSHVDYEYSNGMLSRRVCARGVTATYTYDSAARLKKVEYSDGTPTVEYGYDRRGRVVTVTDGRGTANISYNSDNTVAFEEIPYYTNRQMKYLYDAAGRMTAQGVYNPSTGEWEMQTTYTYDGRSRLASIAQGGRSAVYTRHSLSDRLNTVSFGLIPHLYRAYSPALARFPSCDPIAENGGNFVANTPVTRWDELGTARHPLQDWVAHGDYGIYDNVYVHHNYYSPQENLLGLGKKADFSDNPVLDAIRGPNGRPAHLTMHAVLTNMEISARVYALYEPGTERLSFTKKLSVDLLTEYPSWPAINGTCECKRYLDLIQ